MTRPRKNPGASGIRTRDLPLSRRTPLPLGQRGGDRQTERQADRLPVGSVDQSRVIAPVGEDDRASLGVERVVRDDHLTECGRVQGQNPSHRAGIMKTYFNVVITCLGKASDSMHTASERANN